MFLRMTYSLKMASGKITERKIREEEIDRVRLDLELYREGNHRENLCGQSIHHSHVTAMGRDC